MRNRERKQDETFRSETPPTVWPPTVTPPGAFSRSLRGNWGRGGAIMAGALLMALGFFVLEGVWGLILGILGALLVVGAFAWRGR